MFKKNLQATSYTLYPRPSGFTLVEFLAVVALIGILSTLTVIALRNGRREVRDNERASAVNQIRVGLALGFVQLANYPTQTEVDLQLGGPGAKVLCEVNGKPRFVEAETECTGEKFLPIVPAAPRPADGSCSSTQNGYRYRTGSGGEDYRLEFCLGKATSPSELSNGLNCATADGLKAGACQ
ncbi:type II secretion system protein [Candidatus Uhrbacteria bacterium]|nr:type II secretion system protein [Candidatus Uhrbacteria bacterium]